MLRHELGRPSSVASCSLFVPTHGVLPSHFVASRCVPRALVTEGCS
jgi:hypothetical protein